MKKIIFILLLLLGLGIGIYWAIDNVLPYAAIKRPHFVANWKKEGLNVEPLAVQNDSIRINAFLVRPNIEAKGTIILLHGIANNHGCFKRFTPWLLDLGLNVVLLDLRGHGESGGEYCTFGYYEKVDLQRVTDALEQKGAKQPIGIFGVSLGGAIALQTLALDKRLRFGIIESTFNAYEKVVIEYGEDYLHFRSPSITHRALEKAGQIAHFDPFSVNPVLDCQNIDVPMFMAHGTADDKIPFAFGLENFNALKSSDKTWVPIEGATHHNLQGLGGEAYFEKMKAFILKQIEKTSNP
jgi:uncharacterized protein